MAMFRAWAATQAGGPLQRMDFDPGTLHPEDVEIAVEHCGVCHSDLAMVDSEWFPASNAYFSFLGIHSLHDKFYIIVSIRDSCQSIFSI